LLLPQLLQLQFRDEKLLQAIAQQAQRKAAILTPQDISQLASAYARLSYTHPQLSKLLATQATAKAADFAPWALVHTAWALHTGGQDVGELLGAVVEVLRGEGRLQQLKELDMSTLLWLMAGEGVGGFKGGGERGFTGATHCGAVAVQSP
jgi:hypothetical protein